LELMRIKSSNTSDGKDARMKVKRSLTYFKVPRACPWVSTLNEAPNSFPEGYFL
jgi:hypothetical protein